MPRLIILVALSSAAALILPGCFSVPDSALVYRGSNGQIVHRSTAPCESFAAQQNTGEVDPEGFSVVSWNSHKGSSADWNEDFHSFGDKADFILLQEAAFDSGLEEQLSLPGREWLMAVAFIYDEKKMGILTAGRIAPHAYCTVRGYEPVVKIPKIILLSSYPIKNSDSELLIINLHLVNFTIGTEIMRRQIEAAREKIKSHRGPIIVAGDFNTWNGGRESLVKEEMQALGLQPVSFSPDDRVDFFGRTVDGVYYRGLEVTSATTHQVETSDHNPLEVHFRVVEAGRH